MPQTDEAFLKKLREAFRIEAREHLQALSEGLLEVEKSGTGEQRRREVVEVIFREAHSLKGAARSVNHAAIESICQALESIFATWKKDGVHAGAAAFDTLSRAIDLIHGLLAEKSGAAQQVVAVVQQLRSLESGAEKMPGAAPSVPETAPVAEMPLTHALSDTIRIATAKMDTLLLQTEEMIGVKNAVRQHAAGLQAAGQMMETWRKEWARTEPDFQRTRFAADRSNTGPARIYDFLEWNQSYLSSLENKLDDLAKCATSDARMISGMVDDLLDEAKRLVMLPFATLLDFFPKQVRDLARDQGKQVDLVVRGREVEIDKRILEQMKDPFVHLVRNAIDHGIESPDARAARNKPARGLLTIAVSQLDAGKVEIVVSDDGHGIDVEKLKAAAVKNGLISVDEAARREDREALALIFQSGVSTSAQITEISGRGLGMAIVREKIEKLGGRVEVENQPKRGTAFRIVLPVTLATFKGLLVRCGGQQFILPIANVERVMRMTREQIMSVEKRETISWSGGAISLFRLDAVLGIPRFETAAGKFLQIVILNAGEARMAFVVDEVLHEEEVLVKPLQKPLVRVRNIAAATVLGSGRTVLILNVPDLLQSAVASDGAVIAAAPASFSAKAKSVLVVDDSVTSRMLLKNIMEAAGYDVKAAVDGADAMSALRTQAFDLVVSDVEMPRMNGFELTAKIRADKRLAEIPVVLVTALESREHRERGIDAGANAYIVKSSFEQSNLLDVARRLL